MFGKSLEGEDMLAVQSNILIQVHIMKVKVDWLYYWWIMRGTCKCIAYMNYVITNEFIHFVIPTELQN